MSRLLSLCLSLPCLSLPCLAGSACVAPLQVTQQLERTTQAMVEAHALYAPLCAPADLAHAQANLDFTRIELSQGDVRRATEHLDLAHTAVLRSIEVAKPCAAQDGDRDTIPDIVDLCPHEPEDMDGDNDKDGCRDVDPYGDEDGDGVINLDDGCVDQPEDFDGDADDDGCPETSEDSDGDGIVNVADQCPLAPEDLDAFMDSDGCPDPDNDNDGILDLVDACALVAEDMDGWDDEDGCPDPDNDLDGVPDVNDRCPNTFGIREREGCPAEDLDKDGVADHLDRCPDQPETINQYLDEDGCPDTPPGTVTVTRSRVQIAEMIQFESGLATLIGASSRTLDDVFQVLVDGSYLKLRIEGHTDAEAGHAYNLQLSQDRADAVMRYLLSKGVAPDRLSAVGFGETKPLDTNRTPSGRARNRRVEFHIVR